MTRRIVLKTPFITIPVVSYGLIVTAEDTGRSLIVQRKHSADYINILLGLYRPSHLALMLSNITIDEAKMLLYVINNNKVRELIDDILPDHTDIEYKLTRLREDADLIRKILAQHQPIRSAPEWTWPKGRINYSKREPGFDCAKREFTEEVGVELPEATRIIEQPTQKFSSINGRRIETRLWRYYVQNEFKIGSNNDQAEVRGIKWALPTDPDFPIY